MLTDAERHGQFRSEGEAQGLIYNYERIYGDRSLERFWLDLNQGQIYTPKEPEKILQLVNLARSKSESDGYGEHNAILNLVARRSEMGKTQVNWERGYYVSQRHDPDWVRLGTWLEEQGYRYVPPVALDEKSYAERHARWTAEQNQSPEAK